MEILLSSKTSIIIGIIAVIIYGIPYSKTNKQDLAGAVTIFLATLSIFAAIKIALIAYQMEKCKVEGVGEIEESYIVIGSMSIVWISVVELKKKFSEKLDKQESE